MPEQLPDEGDGLRTVAAELLTAFENLGAEHQVLTAEERETTAAERRGTVRRMIQSHTDANRTLVHSVDRVATVYGLREFGINRQMAKGVEGGDYSPLLALGDPDELLYETATYVQAVVRRLNEAYKPTKKYPNLATARRPQEMKKVLSSLRAALTGLCAELVARDLTEDTAEFDPCIAALGELEGRVCRVVPAQASGPTAEDVTAAILADPEIARAAAAALERTAT
ncbi:hypothetical protein GCM10012285_66010 [Streptomyces kronopolitis]|uniref:Uncharacterized protein n=1 Tax=Streptomyces kronopolitis TaxID=1612435 RepID=A0ABQ2K410_9ACTN|nr:hypothetical protein [Streptomyces kronopolitis]GGN64186.1 hypothetical protein GCM10012285_66010 [Streptomyces kronopolitis]